jgi:hypothetical protein
MDRLQRKVVITDSTLHPAITRSTILNNEADEQYISVVRANKP